MKKTILGMLGVAMIAIMIGSVSAQIPTPIPEPEFGVYGCDWWHPGLTPGFWKHNLEVFLGETKGHYSAIYEEKVNDGWMYYLLGLIRDELGLDPSYDLMTLAGELLAILNEPGWSMDRTNVANWFNFYVGIGPYPMDD